MVDLNRIYTRGGDRGETSLGDGSRVAKHDHRVAAYGTVDEANAVLGLARLHTGATDSAPDGTPGGATDADAMLQRIQNDLFDLGADLCTPQDNARSARKGGALRIVEAQVARLESEIDAMNADLAPLTSFILPGGAAAAAYLHLARTVMRRAERLMTALQTHEPVNPFAMQYANRLSDHLFVLARRLNDNGAGDVLWIPGENR